MNRLLDLPITNILQSQLPRLSSLGSGHTPLRARVLKAKQSHKAGCVEDSAWCPTRFFKEIWWCFIYLGQAWIFFQLNNPKFVCLAFWFLDVHLFLGVEVDAFFKNFHFRLSVLHDIYDWNGVKMILCIFEDHLHVSVNNISFQSLFTCFSYEYTMNRNLALLQSISMYKSKKTNRRKLLLYFSTNLWSFV